MVNNDSWFGKSINWVIRLLTGSLGSPKDKIRLLSVGVGISRKFGACPGASLDATNIYKKVPAKKKTLLVDRQATKGAVLAELVNAVNGTDDSGLFIFFFSGHGGQIRSKDPGEVDGLDETLCVDDGEIVDNEIWNILSNAKCRVFMVTDCCNSGTNYQQVGNPHVFMARTARKSGVRLLHWGGCSDGQYSYGDAAGGELTNAIIRLIGKGISYKDSFNKVKKSVKELEVPTKVSIWFDEDTELFK